MLTLTRNQVREVDRRAIQEYGMSGLVLMENAGRGTADVLCGLMKEQGSGERRSPSSAAKATMAATGL